jgi:hypothetical protein
MKKYPYQTATETQKAIGSWWWCVHHEIHMEQLTEPIENRADYIIANKPAHEIELRLKEMRPVLHPERLPKNLIKAKDAYDKAEDAYNKAKDAYNKAKDAYDKAGDAYNKAKDAYDKAGDAYYKAKDAYKPQLAALHLEEYPDTKWNGKSIFGGEI